VLFGLAAAALVAGSAFAVLLTDPSPVWGSAGCRLEITPTREVAPANQSLDAAREGSRWKVIRTLTYVLPAASASTLHACTDNGSVRLGVGQEGEVLVEARVHSSAEREDEARAAVHALDPEVRAGSEMMAAFEPPHPRLGKPGVAMSFRILVPPSLLVHPHLRSDNGEVVVDGPRLRGLDATTDNGRVRVDPSWAEGSLSLRTDNGEVAARFPALGEAALHASTDNGAIGVKLPAASRYGYDIHAATDNGRVRIELPDVAVEGSEGRHHGQTRGFDQREVQVPVHLRTDNGSITVTSA
jgi:hypothetical protein